MSKRIASVHFYDCFANVNCTATLRSYDSFEAGYGEVELEISDTFAGEGVDDPREWLRDALLALAEAL